MIKIKMTETDYHLGKKTNTKSLTRDPKYEIRNPKQTRMTKNRMTEKVLALKNTG